MSYKQDLPPPGGYGKIPFLRNLPARGPNRIALLAWAGAVIWSGLRVWESNRTVAMYLREEQLETEMCFYPLLEAERDRRLLRDYKTHLESEALNIIGTGQDQDHEIGFEHMYHYPKWREPYVAQGQHSSVPPIMFWFNDIAGIPKLGP